MAKGHHDENLEQIRKLLGDESVVIGGDVTLKDLKRGKTKKVYLASNCSSETKEGIRQYAEGVEVVDLPVPNDELGTFCRKRFSISVISVRK